MAATAFPPSYPSTQYAPAHYDLEKGDAQHFDADVSTGEQLARLGFIRKVFGLLSAQLLLTALVAAPIVLHPGVRAYVSTSGWVVTASFIVSLACLLVLNLHPSARHDFPVNLALLGAFTAAEGVIVGAIAAQYSLASLALAVALTGGITAGLTVYAMRTKRDFTTQGGLMLTLLLALVFGGFAAAFSRSSALDTLIAAAGALLFGAYIVFDVQLIAGGQHTSCKLSPDEYVAGAITVYLDVINLLIYILRLLNDRRD